MLTLAQKKEINNKIKQKFKNTEDLGRGIRKLRAWLWMNQVDGINTRASNIWMKQLWIYSAMVEQLSKHGLQESDAFTYHENDVLEPYEKAFFVAYPKRDVDGHIVTD